MIGLLYGEGDFSKTMEISTRCGQDSDCNPASAGGILGTMFGYSNIPEYWKKPVYPVADMDFKYTAMSLNDVYSIGTKHALKVLELNGAKFEGETINIPFQEIIPVQLEIGFEGHYPKIRNRLGKNLDTNNQEISFSFDGIGFALTGGVHKVSENIATEEVLEFEMVIDGGKKELIKMPSNFALRRHEVAWKYQLAEGEHDVQLKLLHPNPNFKIRIDDLLVYSSTKITNAWKSE